MPTIKRLAHAARQSHAPLAVLVLAPSTRRTRDSPAQRRDRALPPTALSCHHSPFELILFYICVCLCLFVVVSFLSVTDGVIKEKNIKKFGGQHRETAGEYREPEPE